MIKRVEGRLLLGMAAALSLLIGQTFAQEPQDEPVEEERSEEVESTEDVIIVIANQNDDAMAAFRAGNYPEAEIKFKANAFCALRRERNKDAAIESIQRDQSRSEIGGDATSSSSSVSSDGAGGSSQGVESGPVTQSATPGNVKRPEKRREKTCDKRGFQLYMMGLSQLKQGKVDEAMDSFERATVLNKILFDAHYRMGLIKLMRGDKKGAKRELKKIEGILKRCRRCEARQDIIDSRDFLAKAISGEVPLTPEAAAASEEKSQ